MARLATILSFGDHAEEGAGAIPEPQEDYQQEHDDDDDAASDASGDSFEFAFARPLAPAGGEHPADALADDLFAHGRILPAYPVFHRRQAHDDASATSATAPPSPDTYCAWGPRSAPGSPAREPAAFPKSASTGTGTGTGEAARRFRLRDILGSGGRSHSDGKEKFLFLQPTPAKPKTKTSALSTPSAPATKKTQAQQKQGKKKGAAAAPTEMDMATAHRLFYSKAGAAAGPGGERTTTKTSYLPYRPAIVGFFATAHALRPKHHPY
ncbi:hypothetical protein ACQJBY_038459 [Aegilops geniculata]